MFVSLSAAPVPFATPGVLAARALDAAPDTVESGLALAVELGCGLAASEDPGAAGAQLRDLWEALATAASTDLGAARAIEPHLDAVAILTQAGLPVGDGAWGVFAAEGGGAPLLASAERSAYAGTDLQGEDAAGWCLSGTKPWCSLADRLDFALITATGSSGERRLFSVDLRDPGVHVQAATWVARGLTEVPSGPVVFDQVPACAVGEPGWYLERPGFAVGGIGVAACWFGGAVGIGRTVHAAGAARPNPFLLAHLGAIDELLQSSRRALLEASQLAGNGPRADAGGVDLRTLAKRVRATVARACEEIIARAGHALGPAALALDAEHAKRVSDLQLYVRQHHAERDEASLGEALAAGPAPW